MEIGLVLGMLFLWTIILYRELSSTKEPEGSYIRVEVDTEKDPYQMKDKQ